MIIYLCMFLLIAAFGYVFRNNKKLFIISSFFTLFLVAALRKYTIGIDLQLHYANNFVAYAEMSWNKLFEVANKHDSFYDPGLMVFFKLVSCISNNPQCFIIVTSAITYGMIGRYIYKNSENVFMETFLFITTYTYFMFMNIIAQGIALAIVLWSIEFLKKKSYVKFIIVILIANFIHSSAIVCLCFIPLTALKVNRKNIRRIGIFCIAFVLLINSIIPIVLKYVFPQFAYYFASNKIQTFDKSQIAHMLVYIMCFTISMILLYKQRSLNNVNKEEPNENSNELVNQNNNKLNYNFLTYMSMLSITFRLLAIKSYIFSRMGFYVYLFAITLLVNSIQKFSKGRSRRILKISVYMIMIVFFVVLHNSLELAYGVYPYEFCWQ